eukprot:10230863-Heterocapsa_arctica.AAC.1
MRWFVGSLARCFVRPSVTGGLADWLARSRHITITSSSSSSSNSSSSSSNSRSACVSDPFEHVGSSFVESDKRFVGNPTAMAR